MSIRDAEPTDLPTIASLIRELAEFEHMEAEVELAEPDLAHWLFGPQPAARVLVAVDPAAGVIGMALYYVTFSTFLGVPGIWLEDLFVRPAFRGHGHGQALLDTLRGRTAGRVEWSVLEWNQRAIDFYESQGARPVSGWIRYRWAPTDLASQSSKLDR